MDPINDAGGAPIAGATLNTHAKILAAIATAPSFHWSDSDEGAIHVDPFPNPARYGIAQIAGIKLAVDCGPAGIGIGPGH
jgi:hypothetical protein